MDRVLFAVILACAIACSSGETPSDAASGASSTSSGGAGGSADAGSDVDVEDASRVVSIDADPNQLCLDDPTCPAPNAGIVEDCIVSGGCPVFKCWCERCLPTVDGPRCSYECVLGSDGGTCGQ